MDRQLRDRYALAIQQREAGDQATCLATLEAINREKPGIPPVLALLGSVSWDLGNLENATLYFSQAVNLKPAIESYSLGLFHTLLELGHTNEAFAEMSRFVQLQPSDEYERLLDEINQRPGEPMK